MRYDFPDGAVPYELDASSEELLRIYNAASAVNWANNLRDELAHGHMVLLADVFEGWATDSRLDLKQSVKLAGWAESLRQLAELVGPDWDPPEPEQLSAVGFIGRTLLDD
jgi:hypothetical protein